MPMNDQLAALLSHLSTLNRRPSHRRALPFQPAAARRCLRCRSVSVSHRSARPSYPFSGHPHRTLWLLLPIAALALGACQIQPGGSTPTAAAPTRVLIRMPAQTTTCMPIPTPTTQTPEIELPFETVVKSIHSSYEGYDPRMVIVFDPFLVPHLPTLPEEVRQMLQAWTTTPS